MTNIPYAFHDAIDTNFQNVNFVNQTVTADGIIRVVGFNFFAEISIRDVVRYLIEDVFRKAALSCVADFFT